MYVPSYGSMVLVLCVCTYVYGKTRVGTGTYIVLCVEVYFFKCVCRLESEQRKIGTV